MRKSIIAIGAALLGAVAAWAGTTAPDWKPVTQPDAIIGYYTVKDAQMQVALEADGSKLGVFSSDGECRGVAEVMQGPRGKLYQITIGVASSSEANFTFKVWDAASGTTLDIKETIASVAGVETIGTIVDPVTLTFDGENPPPPDDDRPDWKPVPQPDTIIGYYTVKDAQTQVALEADGSTLGVFSSDGECRGVAEVMQGPRGRLYQITIGVASSSEKDFTFKVWDAVSATTYDINETIASVAGVETIGTIVDPVTLTCGVPPPLTTYTVTFNLGEHGTYTGGELEQQVESGKAATAPEFTVEDGWQFTGWNKPFDSVTNDLVVTAQYAPAKISVDIDGVVGDHAYGDVVTATSPLEMVAGYTNLICIGWTGTGDVPTTGFGTQVTFKVTQESSLRWRYQTHYWFEASVDGPGSVVIGEDIFGVDVTGCWVPVGSDLVVEAIADEGAHFAGWRDAETGASIADTPELTFAMDRPALLVADFAITYPTVIRREEQKGAPSVEKKALTYVAYLYDADDGALAGTVQVTAGKGRRDKKTEAYTSKVSVSIVLAGETKKVSISGTYDLLNPEPQTFVGKAKPVREVTLLLSENGVTGSFEGYVIGGVPKVSAAGDYEGTYNIFADEGQFVVTVAKKGTAKVAGVMSDGKSVSVSTSLVKGERKACVPVVLTKYGLAFTLWLEVGTVSVEGLTNAVVGESGTLVRNAYFLMDVDELAELIGDDTYADYFPCELPVEQNAKGKWIVAHGAKAGSVTLNKDGTVNEEKAGVNPSALKLTYTAKKGTFTGSFKAYYVSKGKPKAISFKVTGILVNGIGYGMATATFNKQKVTLGISVE